MIPAHIDRFYFNRKLGKSWKDPSRKKLDLGTTLRCDGAGLSSAGAEGGGVFEGVVIFVTKKCEDSNEEVSKIDSIFLFWCRVISVLFLFVSMNNVLIFAGSQKDAKIRWGDPACVRSGSDPCRVSVKS